MSWQVLERQEFVHIDPCQENNSFDSLFMFNSFHKKNNSTFHVARLIWHTVIHPIRSPKTNGLGHLGIHDIKVISPTKQISFQGLRLHGPRFFMSNPLRRWCLHQNPFEDPIFPSMHQDYRTKHAMRHYDANLPAVFCWACRNFLLKKTVLQKIIVHFGSCQKRCFTANSTKVKWNLRACTTKIAMILVPLWTRVGAGPNVSK